MDDFTRGLTLLFCAAGVGTVLLSWRSAAAAEAGEGEYYALLLTSILGMVLLVAAQNFIVLFIGFELLSIPLYVLCATHMRREHSLESGLKYLIIGSVGSATLLYGLALIYGATGSTDFSGVAAAVGEVGDDPLLLAGVALVVAGLAFKASVAPFHQWTPDVYEGAPTPITAFMAVATKAAAFGVLLRLFDVALIGVSDVWGPALAALAAITIVIGNVGAIGQSSLKRLLAYSSVAQAGLHARRRGRLHPARDPGDDLLPRGLRADEHGRVRGDHRPRARVRGRRRHLLALRPRRRPAVAGVADDDRDALARRLPGHRRLLRQALPDPGGRRQRVRLARRGDRDRLGDLARLLPARHRGGLDAAGLRRHRRGEHPRARRAPRDGRRVARGRRRRGGPWRRARPVAAATRSRRPTRRPPPRRPAVACASPRWPSSPSSARSPRSPSGSGPSRSSTSPATRARRSPRSSSPAACAAPAHGARSDREGRTSAAPAYTVRVTSSSPPRRRAGLARVRRAAGPRGRRVRGGRAGGGGGGGAGARGRGRPDRRVHRRRRRVPGLRRRGGRVAPVHAVGRAARRRAGRHGPVGPRRRRSPVARGAALRRLGRRHEGRARRRRGQRRARATSSAR